MPGMTYTSARTALRAETRDEHDRVDKAYSRFSLTEPESYCRFLRAQAAVFLPLEAAIDASRPERVLEDWPARQRSHLLREDLAELGTASADVPAASPFETIPELLGTVYVLEGSRLGGAMLERSVPEGLPRRFLRSSDSARWRSLIALLDRTLVDKNDRALAVGAAKSTFARFERNALDFQG